MHSICDSIRIVVRIQDDDEEEEEGFGYQQLPQDEDEDMYQQLESDEEEDDIRDPLQIPLSESARLNPGKHKI